MPRFPLTWIIFANVAEYMRVQDCTADDIAVWTIMNPRGLPVCALSDAGGSERLTKALNKSWRSYGIKFYRSYRHRNSDLPVELAGLKCERNRIAAQCLRVRQILQDAAQCAKDLRVVVRRGWGKYRGEIHPFPVAPTPAAEKHASTPPAGQAADSAKMDKPMAERPKPVVHAAELCLAVLFNEPEISPTELAKRVGVRRSTLYSKSPRWKHVRQTLVARDTHRLPKGEKTADGDLEAVHPLTDDE